MLLILAAMIVGSSLTAFSLPVGSASASPFSGLRLSPQKSTGDAPFSAPTTGAAPSIEPGKPAQRGSLINLSV